MSCEQLRLSKKLFMTLKPGRCIMGTFIPLAYEEIGNNPEGQWQNWRKVNGSSVYVFDSKERCLKAWRSMSCDSGLNSTSEVIYEGIRGIIIFIL